ncbi:MAG: hypothetical protein C5B55_06710 [Blastocatellia bacterium]|nr:MAG: hypothetical protein C5B55_06710 [Blastocatellia bacterium]
MRFGKFDRTALAAIMIFLTTATIFLISRVHQVADSSYSMLLSESLLHHGSFTLDAYEIPRLSPQQQAGYLSNGPIYQIQIVGDHLYYYFPAGTSVLSLPYVAVMNLFGISAANPDGTYNRHNEVRIEASLAALLMAALSAVIFLTARLLLPFWWSVVIAYASAFGTQIWSTSSRALWSDTWGIFLLGITIWMLVAVECKRFQLRPVLLATVCAWMYFARPTFSIPILAITVYVFMYHRQERLKYLFTGLAWLALFVGFSEYHYGHSLPNYYSANRLSFGTFGVALAGNLISPSRGLLVFVPVLIFVAYLLIRYWRETTLPRLLFISITVIAIHIITISGFTPWWGGHCFGPRYSAGLVPFFALLGIIAVKSKLTRSSNEDIRGWSVEWTIGLLLLFTSVLINAVGSNSLKPQAWNLMPTNIDEHPERVWDWKHPQFLPR